MVNAVPKGEVRILLAGNIKPVWVGEMGRVAIGRSEQEQGLLILAYGFATHLNIFECYPCGDLHRTVIAEKFFNCFSTTRGVNAFVTNLRSRVWSGGFFKSIQRLCIS